MLYNLYIVASCYFFSSDSRNLLHVDLDNYLQSISIQPKHTNMATYLTILNHALQSINSPWNESVNGFNFHFLPIFECKPYIDPFRLVQI